MCLTKLAGAAELSVSYCQYLAFMHKYWTIVLAFQVLNLLPAFACEMTIQMRGNIEGRVR